jgi:hypothetical protein
MREKILAELRKKYPGLSAAVLGLLAEKLEPTTTEESQIETAVSGLENLPIKPADYAALLQKEGDRRVTEALKKKPTEQTPTPQKEDEPADPTAKLMKQIEAMSAKLEAIEKKESQKTVAEQLHAKLKEKKIPLQFAQNINSIEELDSAVETAEKAYTEVKQELINEGLISGLGKPGGGGADTLGNKTKTAAEADIKAWAEKNKPVSKV